MKNATRLFIAVFIIINISCKTNLSKDNFSQYQIISIDSIENVYVIHTKSVNKYYKIVSEKEYNHEKGKKIKIGKFYKFNLTSLFKEREKFRTNFDGADFKGQSILVERDSIYDIHTAQQLRGLYFIER